MIIKDLLERNVLKENEVPDFVHKNLGYMTMLGSVTYGASSDMSDKDVYGFCFPPVEYLFPNRQGCIEGFVEDKKVFNQWQLLHLKDDANEVEYDFNIYNIVKFIHLCSENNPNMLETLFTDQEFVMFESGAASMLRENKHILLHQGAYAKFAGFAMSQIHKIDSKEATENPKRQALIAQYGWDTKFGYHAVRIMDEGFQIAETGTLDLRKNSQKLLDIRQGKWTKQEVVDYVKEKDSLIKDVFAKSGLPKYPDRAKVKSLLLDVLEYQYGDLRQYGYVYP